MPSLLPNYEYDIFISYRHNDNRSGWVTEFVKALQDELAATVKDPISIYFDSNPHDGLHETHDVDGSLKEKVKCLVFIPIVSQTYCDPKSFAWQKEFQPFIDFTKEDEFGLDIKVSGGNVTKRVLPVRIHEIDKDDKKLFEDEMGGVMRPVDFIYKEAGVNRPLSSNEENPSANLNQIFYKNQVNKVANAIKELIIGIKATSVTETTTNSLEQEPAVAVKQKKGLRKSSNALIGVLLVAVVISLFWYINNKGATAPEATDKSLVVLPFEDLSEGQDQEWFSDGLTEELLNRLSEVHQLRLISRTTSFSFKGKNLSAKKIADSLGVSYILEGSVRKANDQLRITAQLIRAKDDTHLWSSTYDHKLDSIFIIQDHISQNITSALNIVLDEKERSKMLAFGTRNVKAYEEYLKGIALFNEGHFNDFNLLLDANEHFEKATALDPKFAAPYYSHQDAFTHHLMHGMFAQQFANYSEKDIAGFIAHDLDAAIKFAPSSDQRLRYQMDKYILSDNWSELPQLIDEIKARKISPPGWGKSIFLITDPEYITTSELRQLNRDRFDQFARIYAAAGLANVNLLDSASSLLDLTYLNSSNGIILKSFIEIRNGNPENAMALLANKQKEWKSQYVFSKMLAGMSTRQEIKKYVDSIASVKPEYSIGVELIHFYHALGEYEKVDNIARQIDAKMMGPLSLTDYYIFSGLFFHLSATPNLAKRLRELGIDPVAFEKKHYYVYPKVVFTE